MTLKTFEQLFKTYYDSLFQYAQRFVSPEVAEELIHDVFLKIWQQRDKNQIKKSPSAYLHRAIKNSCLNYLKSRIGKLKHSPLDHLSKTQSAPLAIQNLEALELSSYLQQVISNLPEKCQIIFRLSREAEMTYAEIAEELDISKESVKTQIKIALARLRTALEQFNE